MSSQNIDHDTRWKEIIEHLFEDFVAFFMPDLFKEIDFSRTPTFLKQELYKIIADSDKKGNKVNDTLVKVYLKNKKEQWILIHVEVQTDHETVFSERMFGYFYRIYDKFKIKEITAIALFVGEKVPKDYNQFTNKYFGTEINYKYNTYQVRKQSEKELQKSKNPFAIAVLAALYIIKTKKNLDNRLKLKIALINFIQKRVKEGNFPKSIVVPLVLFVMHLMRLDKKREELFQNQFYNTVKNKNMFTMTDYDRQIADVINLALYGETFKMMEERLKKEAKEAEETAMKKAKEAEEMAMKKAKEAEEMAMKKAKEAEEMAVKKAKEETEKAVTKKTEEIAKKVALKMKIQTIINLHHQAKMHKEDIASVMGVEVAFVEKVIEENQS